MAKVVVLGGCGAVGRVASRTLAAHDTFDTVVVADIDVAGARALCDQIGGEGLEAAAFDAGDGASVAAVVRGADVVLNCVGPFYRFVETTLRAVIAEKVDYVDVCDDVDVTPTVLAMDGAAKEAGVSALIGMGSSPGVTNLLARVAADLLLDETESVDIFHAHGGEAMEGAGVVAHRFHCMSMDIPMFLDGELKTVKFFEPDGVALQEEVSLHLLGDGIRVYPYPHPEQLTIPQHIALKRVTNRGTVLPDAYYELTADLARIGMASREPLDVGGQTVIPHDVAIAHVLRERDRILKECAFGAQRGCVKVVVQGIRHGKPRGYIFSMASTDQALGEGTGIPAALGAILMAQGKIVGPGVLPPEAAVPPLEFLALIQPVLASGSEKGSFDGLRVEMIDENGDVAPVDLPF